MTSLADRCWKALDEIELHKPREEYEARLRYELGVFEKSGYENLILIIQDYINHARDNGIIVGPGRGSAAGSLVVFLVGITTIDPLRFGLIFERFLNPERVSLPDIDTDFSDRDFVITYLKTKYGCNRVAKVGVPSLFKPRSAIDDFARMHQVDFAETKRITKLIGDSKSFAEAFEEEPDLAKYETKHPDIFKLARAAQGHVRMYTTHPSAVILANQPIGAAIPMMRPPGAQKAGGELVTQWDGEELDQLGYAKLDILGLDNLTIISKTLEMIGKDISFFYNVPLDDKKTLTGFKKGETVGVFQMEEDQTVGILTGLKQMSFEDVCATNALIRPGLDVPGFIHGRNDPESIKYDIPELEPILGPTHGALIYQEQVMKICQVIGGFSLAKADKVRKIIAKTGNQRDMRGLGPVEKDFKDGYLKNGYPEDKFESLWERILKTQQYCFNKCLSGDTQIYDCDSGTLISLKECYDNGLDHTLADIDGSISKVPVKDVYHSGKQEVFLLELESGHQIKATAEHYFKTQRGWVRLKDLKDEDEVYYAAQEDSRLYSL